MDDLRLVEDILAGDEDAWHRFMETYADLIIRVAGRYLFDEDEVAGVQAEVFKTLHKGRFGAYRGRSSLAAWVAVVSRNIAADHLRNKFGRREIPVGLKKLSVFHREVFQLYYVEGVSFPAALAALRLQDPELDSDCLLAALQDIHDKITDKTLRRIAYDLAAPSVGAASGRLLEYCHHSTWDEEDGKDPDDPLARLMLKEAEARTRRILALVEDLPHEEQRILTLRFERGMKAKDIAAKMGLSGQRKAYTVLDRILKKVRRLLGEEMDELL